MRVHVKGMEGIGDSLYARPFIKMLVNQGHEVYLSTPLPRLYLDLTVKQPGTLKLLPYEAKYRTQKAELAASEVKFHTLPASGIDREINYYYDAKALKARAIVPHMEKCFGFEPGSTLPIFDLPPLPPPFLDLVGRRVAVVRPVTKRREWICETRSPNPSYVAWCARILRDAGYYVISVADCAENEEWIEGEAPPADLQLHRGELGIMGTLSLLQEAKVIVSGSGFMIPAAISAGTPLFILFGGRGAYDNPHKLLDLRMDLKKIGWALPRNFCRCDQMTHTCDKTIPDLDDRFFNFMRATR